MSSEIFSKPVALKVGSTGIHKVRSIRSAVRFMTNRWPEEAKGKKYERAMHACCDVVEGYGSPELAERTFRLAAADAGILLDGTYHPPRQQDLHRVA